MLSARNVGDYIVYLAMENGLDVTNQHIQKTLFYLQSVYLVEEDRPLFDEVIEYWRLGVVVPDVYKAYGGQIGNIVTGVREEPYFDEEIMGIRYERYCPSVVGIGVRIVIVPIILKLLELSMDEIIDISLTHKLTKVKLRGHRYKLINTDIQEYFLNNSEELERIVY